MEIGPRLLGENVKVDELPPDVESLIIEKTVQKKTRLSNGG